MTATDDDVEQIDLLAALQASFDRARDARRAAPDVRTATKPSSEGQDTGDATKKAPRLSRERRREVAEARRAKTAERQAQIATRTAPTGYRVGWWVRTNTPRCRPFHNRIGVVVTNNLGEVGVGFGFDWAIQLPGVDAWFLPSELERVR